MFRGLRVAIVAPPYYEVPPRGYGGIELVCALLAEGLVARGHHVTVIGAGPDRIQADFVATFPEATTEELPDYMRVEIVHAARASRIVSGLDLDIVHDHTRLGALMAMSRSLPTVLTVHAALAGPDSSADELEAVAPWMHPVAISEAQRHDGPQVPWAATVHNGIDTNRYPFRADKEDFVLYLGRVSEHKGVHFAIDAARAAGVKLRIAGSWTNGDERSYFEEQIRPRLDDDVSWHGEVQFEQKLDLLSRARCLLLPAQWREPFGLVIVEAMACGTPVVALRAGALPELVAEGRTGMLCDQPAELSDALQRIHEFEPAACRAHAVEHFDVARMVSRYEALYAQVLQLR